MQIGNWGNWGGYGSCSETCGGGQQYRTRACNSPAPSNGGSDCAGSSSSSQSCNTASCSSDDCMNCLAKYNIGGITCYPSGRESRACAKYTGTCGSL
eukprot:Awhi_evm1s2258